MARISARSEAEVVEAVRTARKAKRTMEIVGAGTKRGLGRPVACDDMLDVSGLSGILKYEPDELVITALAGTPVAEIEAMLGEKNQRLGFEPADWGPLFGSSANCATIGGVLAADASGSAAIRYGRARDHLLGFRAVNGLGEAYKAGGRVVKNVTGFDLPKLMCGAMGILGPLTEVTLRVVPRAPLARVLLVRNVAAEAGFALLRRVWSSPLEATGLAFVPDCAGDFFAEFGEIGSGAAIMRLEGSAAALQEKIAMLRELCDDRTIAECEGDVFRRIGGGRVFADTSLNVWRVTLPPSRAAELLAQVSPSLWLADWAGSLLWLGTDSDMREIAHQSDGRAVLMRAPETERRRIAVFEPEDAVRAQLTRRVKAAFDPLGLFNPGRMWEGV
ncbi:MAG TPA: FAD-binding protein [Rhizomicrobium sp.]|jgi:glycolate oxidase FAD binding subunit